jgi:CBS domain-containing membrane protein
VACASAAALAVIAMLFTSSLHPPATAAAVLGALGGSAGWLFPFAPLGLNLGVLIAVGVVFHRFAGHTYPHVFISAFAAPPTLALPVIEDEDIDTVLSDVGLAFDIERDDLRILLARLEQVVAARLADQTRDAAR